MRRTPETAPGSQSAQSRTPLRHRGRAPRLPPPRRGSGGASRTRTPPLRTCTRARSAAEMREAPGSAPGAGRSRDCHSNTVAVMEPRIGVAGRTPGRARATGHILDLVELDRNLATHMGPASTVLQQQEAGCRRPGGSRCAVWRLSGEQLHQRPYRSSCPRVWQRRQLPSYQSRQTRRQPSRGRPNHGHGC